MDFAVFALSSVPDVPTARRVMFLNDLDDKSVTKVLYHQRKQQADCSAPLRWDQHMLAAVTVIRHSADGVEIASTGLPMHAEREMLQSLLAHVSPDTRWVTWRETPEILPLLRFRLLMHGLRIPRALQATSTGSLGHLDIGTSLATPSDEAIELDELARKLGLPGMLGLCDLDRTAAWLQERHADLQAYADLRALNICLLALRYFTATGDLSGEQRADAETALRDLIADTGSAQQTDFLSAWDHT